MDLCLVWDANRGPTVHLVAMCPYSLPTKVPEFLSFLILTFRRVSLDLGFCVVPVFRFRYVCLEECHPSEVVPFQCVTSGGTG